MNKIILLLFLLFSISSTCFSQDPTAEIYFKSGIQKYLKGDTEKAIADLEVAFNLDPENEKIKAILVKTLIERGTELYLRKYWREALPYLKRAKFISPENEEVKRMYDLAKKQITSYRTALPAETVTPAKPQPLVKVDEKGTEMSLLFESFVKQQDKFITSLAKPQETIKELISGARQERQDLRKTLRSTIFLSIGGIIGLIALIALLLYLIIIYTVKKREAREMKFMQQQERALNIMQQQQLLALGHGGRTSAPQLTSSAQGPSIDKFSAEEMLASINPNIRAKGVEIIEGELVTEGDPEIAESLLKPFLEDKNSRVRANAIKAFYKFKPEVSLKLAENMVNDKERWMQATGAWVLGQFPCEGSVKILLKAISSQDKYVKKRVIGSLKKISESNEISEKLKKNIIQALEKIQSEEGWIVE